MCRNAEKLTQEEKRAKIRKRGACYRCLRSGHMISECAALVKCTICGQDHLSVMCNLRTVGNREKATNVTTQLNCTSEVLLQTVVVNLRAGTRVKRVRALLDSGSQRTYVLESTMKELGADHTGEITLSHGLFGGTRQTKTHKRYRVETANQDGDWAIQMEALGQNYICGRIPRTTVGPWMSELNKRNITVGDLESESTVIEMLVGSDYYGSILEGRVESLSNGLVAIQTRLGWCVSGRMEVDTENDSLALAVTSFEQQQLDITSLWKLDTLGITDPIEQLSRGERELDVKRKFWKDVHRNEEGRYIVQLPWIGQNIPLPDNKTIAMARLKRMTSKLNSSNKYELYDKIFQDWLRENLIEECEETQERSYYLPHRAVFKEQSLTTPVRPVFDASCKTGRNPSLNDCLEKGPNLLELIPALILRFRERRIGLTADIRKAFQMIEVREEDRDSLRFLWWREGGQKETRIFRHTRVVFGVKSSPFLLAAVLEKHLDDNGTELSRKLWKSFYVDNCVASVESMDEYTQFRNHATKVMEDAKMELRQWCCSGLNEEGASENTSVLGLKWNTCRDTLACVIPSVDQKARLDKKRILSIVSQIFDPLGLLAPVTLVPKLILQETWTQKLGWEQEVPEEIALQFSTWSQDINLLASLEIPRYVKKNGTLIEKSTQLHAFADASGHAYAAVVFLRTEFSNKTVTSQLLLARARVAPLNKPTIPRLELLSCLLAARLLNTIKISLENADIPVFLWTDSTTALAWIQRNNNWGTFVGNRVKEICSLTKQEDWRHIPGEDNPADLPSRGCSPKALLASRWWEGPSWLHSPIEEWPRTNVTADEGEIHKEERLNCQNLVTIDNRPWYLPTSNYMKNLRVIARILRWKIKIDESNTRKELTVEEIEDAEVRIIRLIQKENGMEDKEYKGTWEMVKSTSGLVCVKTRISHGVGLEFSNQPILLPNDHLFVTQLVEWYHNEHHHAGTQMLILKVRERFWLPKARRTINNVIRRCVRCNKLTAKPLDTPAAPLPVHRWLAREAFQNTGVDLAGPLTLRNGQKAWIVLFTCAVYRGVHLDLIMSLSTEAFLRALERFINSKGRPEVVYSDNGSNFVGMDNLFRRINWEEVENKMKIKRIQWIFNPPTAAWWGGWWERLVRSMKDLLKRMLGKTVLDYDQLRTCLSHAERVINERPLTALSDEPSDLTPLTPAMFLTGGTPATFPETTLVGVKDLRQRLKWLNKIKEELRNRFRKEYVSLMVQKAKERKSRTPQIGDLVWVGSDDKKRVTWPLGKIEVLFPGRDGEERVASVRTQGGVLIRPLQRLYPMEMPNESEKITNNECVIQPSRGRQELPPVIDNTEDANRTVIPDAVSDSELPVTTRSGRRVTRPRWMNDYG